MAETLTAYVYEGGVAILAAEPGPAAALPGGRCLHCCRGRQIAGQVCCEDCRERGHAGPWRECNACRQERLLLLDRAQRSLWLARWELQPEPVY